MGLLDRFSDWVVAKTAGTSDVDTARQVAAGQEAIIARQRDEAKISEREAAALTQQARANGEYLDDYYDDRDDLLGVIAPEILPDSPKANKWIAGVGIVLAIAVLGWLFVKGQKHAFKVGTSTGKKFLKI